MSVTEKVRTEFPPWCNVDKQKLACVHMQNTRVFLPEQHIIRIVECIYINMTYRAYNVSHFLRRSIHSANTFSVFEYSATMWMSSILSMRCLSCDINTLLIDYNGFAYFSMCLSQCIVTYMLCFSQTCCHCGLRNRICSGDP